MDKLAYNGGTAHVTIEGSSIWPLFNETDIRSVTEILDANIITCYDQGKKIIEETEIEFNKLTKSSYSLLVNSGTQALFLSYYGIGLKANDEVIVPVYTYPGTITPLYRFGAIPVFVDTEPDSFNIDAKAIEDKITPNTKAIVITHMRGLPCDMDLICAIATKHNLHLIEDASHALASTYNEKHVGTFGTFGCFSLSADKLISGGTAGILTIKDRAMYLKVKALVDVPSRTAEDDVSEVDKYIMEIGYGLNFKSNPLTAGLIKSQIMDLNQRLMKRTEGLLYLSEILDSINGIESPKRREGSTRGGWYGYQPRYDAKAFNGLKKDYFLSLLKMEGVKAGESRLKPIFLYNFITCPETLRRLGGGEGVRALDEWYREYPNAMLMYKTSFKIDIDTSDNTLELYKQYGQTINKLRNNLETLPLNFFE